MIKDKTRDHKKKIRNQSFLLNLSKAFEISSKQKIHGNAENRRPRNREQGEKITNRVSLSNDTLVIRSEIKIIKTFKHLYIKDWPTLKILEITV